MFTFQFCSSVDLVISFISYDLLFLLPRTGLLGYRVTVYEVDTNILLFPTLFQHLTIN